MRQPEQQLLAHRVVDGGDLAVFLFDGFEPMAVAQRDAEGAFDFLFVVFFDRVDRLSDQRVTSDAGAIQPNAALGEVDCLEHVSTRHVPARHVDGRTRELYRGGNVELFEDDRQWRSGNQQLAHAERSVRVPRDAVADRIQQLLVQVVGRNEPLHGVEVPDAAVARQPPHDLLGVKIGPTDLGGLEGVICPNALAHRDLAELDARQPPHRL